MAVKIQLICEKTSKNSYVNKMTLLFNGLVDFGEEKQKNYSKMGGMRNGAAH